MKRWFVPVWLMTLALGGLLAVAVTESASQPAPTSVHSDPAVVEALVRTSLEIADAADPLLRAKGAAAVAQSLADAVQRAAKRGDAVQAAKLKVWLNKVLDQAVRYNVEAVDPETLEGARKALWTELNDRPEVIGRSLEAGLQSLNAPLKQALTDADQSERERDKGRDKGKAKFKDKGKGKGPPPPWADDFKGWDKGKDKKGKRDQSLLPEALPHFLDGESHSRPFFTSAGSGSGRAPSQPFEAADSSARREQLCTSSA